VPDSLLVIQDEERHAKYRRPIQHAYSLASLKGYEPYVDDIIQTLVDVIDRHVESGEAINISSWFYFFVLFVSHNRVTTSTKLMDVLGSYDVIGKVTFEKPTGYLKAGKDFNNLIKRQQRFFEYVNVVKIPLSSSRDSFGVLTLMTGFSNACSGPLLGQKPYLEAFPTQDI
jgi:hypothetical protein